MQHEYHVVYEPVEDGWIMPQAPELPGAVTQGRTIEEARANTRDAVELLLPSSRDNARKDAQGNAL